MEIYGLITNRLASLFLVVSLNAGARFLEAGPGYNTKRRPFSAVEVPSVEWLALKYYKGLRPMDLNGDENKHMA